jgi:hypothetical protein
MLGKRLAATLLSLWPLWASAQICSVSMSFDRCSEELGEKLPAEAAAMAPPAAAARAQNALATMNTGTQNDGETATDDFNPKLQVTADTLGVNDTGGKGVTLSWGDFFRSSLKKRFFGEDGTAKNVGQHHKLVVKLQEATLFEPLKTAITDPQLAEKMQSSLNDFDDVFVDFKLSLNSATRGRDLQRHQNLIAAIQRATMDPLELQLATLLRATDAEDVLLQRTNLSDTTKPLDEALRPAEAAALVEAMESARRAQLDYVSFYEAEARKNGLFDLVDLVNNQPQIVLAVENHIRDDRVGPDESALKFTYELGGANVNRYRRYKAAQVELDANRAPEARVCADEVRCLKSYVNLNRDVIKQGNRLAFSLRYASKSRYDFDQSGVALHFDSERSLIAELAYGRYVNLGFAGGEQRSRIDVSAGYEDVAHDPQRQDRSLVKATFAQELGNGLFLTIGVVWANKPEFRGDVDREVSARAGITYKLARK